MFFMFWDTTSQILEITRADVIRLHECSTLFHPDGFEISCAIFSAIIITVAFVFARTTSGIIEASTTRSDEIPWTLPVRSTTAEGSSDVPILQVPEE